MLKRIEGDKEGIMTSEEEMQVLCKKYLEYKKSDKGKEDAAKQELVSLIFKGLGFAFFLYLWIAMWIHEGNK